jgi:hypothetical protein
MIRKTRTPEQPESSKNTRRKRKKSLSVITFAIVPQNRVACLVPFAEWMPTPLPLLMIQKLKT